MPLYDFECTACKHTFEKELPMGSKENPACPECAAATEKKIAPPSVIFKGSGFYKTDQSAPKSPEGTKSAENGEKGSTEAKEKPDQKTGEKGIEKPKNPPEK